MNYPALLSHGPRSAGVRSDAKALRAAPRQRRFTAVSGVRRRRHRHRRALRVSRASGGVDDESLAVLVSMGRQSRTDRDCTN